MISGQVVTYRERGKRLDVGVQRKEPRRRQRGHAVVLIVGGGRPTLVRTEGMAAAGMIAGPPEQPLAGGVWRGWPSLPRAVKLLAASEDLAEGILAHNGTRIDGVDDGGTLGRLPSVPVSAK
jgi:hypothetical protein